MFYTSKRAGHGNHNVYAARQWLWLFPLTLRGECRIESKKRRPGARGAARHQDARDRRAEGGGGKDDRRPPLDDGHRLRHFFFSCTSFIERERESETRTRSTRRVRNASHCSTVQDKTWVSQQTKRSPINLGPASTISFSFLFFLFLVPGERRVCGQFSQQNSAARRGEWTGQKECC